MATLKYHVMRGPNQQAHNRQILAEGVKGVKCVFAGATAINEAITFEHMSKMRRMLMRNERLGTCEVYANGAWNVFVRQAERVIGVFTYRKEE